MMAANEFTLALITLNQKTDDTVNYIISQGFTSIQHKTVQFSLEQAQAFFKDHQDQSYYDKFINWLTKFTIYAMVLEKPNAIQEWKQLMGPANYKKARKINPKSIRAMFGKNGADNVTHGSDSIENAKKEIDFIFATLHDAKPKKFSSQIPVPIKSKLVQLTNKPKQQCHPGPSRIARFSLLLKTEREKRQSQINKKETPKILYRPKTSTVAPSRIQRLYRIHTPKIAPNSSGKASSTPIDLVFGDTKSKGQRKPVLA